MACKVKVNRHGLLAFRLYWDGHESWEGTGLKDTPKHRQRMEARAVLINEEMEQGAFDYLKWFPEGNKAAQFRPEPERGGENKPVTVSEFFKEWISRKKPPFVRLSLERDYKQAFSKNILPFMGDLDLNKVTIETLEDFRMHLVKERRLSVKSARNIIDGSLRAMFRDAGRRIERNPFNDLPANWWPRLPQREPDPYTEEERDRILKFYRE